jgi:hypothetical protein
LDLQDRTIRRVRINDGAVSYVELPDGNDTIDGLGATLKLPPTAVFTYRGAPLTEAALAKHGTIDVHSPPDDTQPPDDTPPPDDMTRVRLPDATYVTFRFDEDATADDAMAAVADKGLLAFPPFKLLSGDRVLEGGERLSECTRELVVGGGEHAFLFLKPDGTATVQQFEPPGIVAKMKEKFGEDLICHGRFLADDDDLENCAPNTVIRVVGWPATEEANSA